MEYSPNGYRPLDPKMLLESRSSTVLTLAIIGLVIFFLPIANIAGLIVSIIAVSKAGANRTYALENGLVENSRNSVGRTLGIIGIVINALSVLIGILAVVFIGVFFVSVFTSGLGEEIVQSILPIVETAVSAL